MPPASPPSTLPAPDLAAAQPLSYRAAAAAKALGVSERQLSEWTRNGEIPHVPRGPRMVLYPRKALLEWLEQQTVGGNLDAEDTHDA